jgi:hypothetical protein
MAKQLHIHIHRTTDSQSKLQAELEEISAKIEALEDKGVTVYPSLLNRRKFLQTQLSGFAKLAEMRKVLEK